VVPKTIADIAKVSIVFFIIFSYSLFLCRFNATNTPL
jgi:hypothetical protein